MITRHEVAVFGLLALIGSTMSAAAQERNKARQPVEPQPLPWDFRDFADPEKFLPSFFGPDSAAERQALERVEISPSDERTYGNRAAQAFLSELRRHGIQITSRGRDVEYLRRLVAVVQTRMKNRARYPAWQIHIAEADPTEAKCFPGGTLVFFRGLLDDARSEATLVAVIAHELSHVDHGHQLNLLRRMKLAEQTFANPGAGGPRSFLQNGPLLMRAFTHPFRPEDETEADRDATQWSYELGYDPREFAELFQRLQQRAPVTVNLPAFLRTHPPHADRHRAILATFEELQRKSPVAELYVGRENLRRRLPREQQAFEE